VLAQAGVRVPQYVQEADQLTRFAVDARYPSLSSPVTKREHRRAVRIATGILRWAEKLPKFDRIVEAHAQLTRRTFRLGKVETSAL
jgi:hypothetical protein